MDKIGLRILSPWWFMAWLAGSGGIGYLTDGRLGAVEGALIAVILAHGALLEVLREKLDEIDLLRGMFPGPYENGGKVHD